MLLLFSRVVLLSAVAYALNYPEMLLNDGNKMPALGFGTFGKVDEIYKVEESVIWAVEAGYRHIDTAAVYLNEEQVGKAINNVLSRGIVRREDLFITTKLNFGYNSSMVLTALNASLTKLQMDYVDLYLIHTPSNWLTQQDYYIEDTWKGMEEVKRMGLAKSIGVANFDSSHINKILKSGSIRPAVNQVEVNPTFASLDLVAYCQQEDIVVTSYGPNGFLVPRPYLDVSPPPAIDDSILLNLGEKYGKTAHQLFIRYLMDRGTVPIPKSFTKERILENFEVLDFSFSKHEIYLMNEFNKNIKIYDFDTEVIDSLMRYYFGQPLEDFFES